MTPTITSMAKILIALLILAMCATGLSARGSDYHDYCIIGAGPAGLQMGYFLQGAGRDYIVFEKSNSSGNFFNKYPRHRKLISINKRHTGKTNPEFNLRHDWNSLLSHDPELLMTKYSKEMFPHADVLVRYLDDYQKKLGIRVQFNTEIKNIRTVKNLTAPDGHVFTMEDNRDQSYTCRTMIVATGLFTPNIPKIPKSYLDLTVGLDDVSLDPDDYEGKSVCFLGRGNSAMEMAQSIYGSTNFVHFVSRSRVRLSWATHYVGDIRGVNNELLDTYQLKSLDGFADGFDVESLTFHRTSEGKIRISPKDDPSFITEYDIVIRALGFVFDDSIFNKTSIATKRSEDIRTQKYPTIKHNYESDEVRGMFYAGTASHSLDFRKSSGGFIHGFRYTARALHRLLEWRYESSPWPKTVHPTRDLYKLIVKRINEASGPYQMFGVLGDIVLFSQDHQTVTYLEEFPVRLLHQLPTLTGSNVTDLLVVLLEYGHNFSGPGKDVFRSDRSVGEPYDADESNFLHPVLYYYKTLPTEEAMLSLGKSTPLPRPDRLHFVVEDFHTEFLSPMGHLFPLLMFLENITGFSLRTLNPDICFQMAMTMESVPYSCASYMSGQVLGFSDIGKMTATRVV